MEKIKYKSKALNTMVDLLHGKYEMVRLQAATSILKLSSMFSDNSTPESDKAKTRKTNDEATLAEEHVREMKQLTNEDNKVLNDLLDKVHNGVDYEDTD